MAMMEQLDAIEETAKHVEEEFKDSELVRSQKFNLIGLYLGDKIFCISCFTQLINYRLSKKQGNLAVLFKI